MSDSNAYPLTRGRVFDATRLVMEARATLNALRERGHFPAVIGDLPERLAVLEGLLDRQEESMWQESVRQGTYEDVG